MQGYSETYDPDAAVRSIGVRINFLDDYSELSLGTEDVISLELTEGLDITTESFPSRSIKLRAVDSLGLSFASLKTDYVGVRFQVLIGINGEYIPVGIYYIDSIDTEDLGLTVSIVGSDRVKTYMDKYLTGLYVSSPMTLEYLVENAPGALSGLDIYCDEAILGYYVYPRMMTTVDTQRECLLTLAQAAGFSSIWVARDGVIHMERIAGRTGYSATIDSGSVLEYSSLKLGSHVDYVELSGENEEGSTFYATCGTYTRGCLAEFLTNDFIYEAGAGILVMDYYESKNQRFELKLKTRCNPALEPSDRVLVTKPDGSEIGEFTLTSQTIHFDEDGLWSELTLSAPSPTDS
ncbi:MAG: hypothetical protein LUE20_10905 [Oscillospiraceae bacterium]|nr:hypothetical protein [Oscillospiraceae bacterium]